MMTAEEKAEFELYKAVLNVVSSISSTSSVPGPTAAAAFLEKFGGSKDVTYIHKYEAGGCRDSWKDPSKSIYHVGCQGSLASSRCYAHLSA